MHPPYVGGTGYVFAVTPPMTLPSQRRFALLSGQGRRQRCGRRILFRVAVDSKGKETIVAEKQWLQHA